MTLADLAPTLNKAERLVLVDRLTLTTRRVQESLVRATSNAVYAEWINGGQALSIELWAGQYTAIVSGAQLEAYTITQAAIAEHGSLMLGRPLTTPPLVAGSSGWLAQAGDFEARVATISRNAALGQGVAFGKAVDTAGRVASGRAAQQIQMALRQAGTDWNKDKPASERPRGWRKVTSGAACGWCVVVADQLYQDSGTVSTHGFDRCGMSPVFADEWQPGGLRRENDGRAPNYDEIRKQPASPEAATVADAPAVTAIDSTRGA